MKILHSIIVPSVILFNMNAFSQETSETHSPSHFKIGVSYLSDNVYLGRKDSVATPYLSPTIGYYNKSGFYITSSAAYITSEQRMDNYTLNAGYAFNKEKWDGEFNLNKYFFSSQSYTVKSEIKGDVTVSAGYDFGFIKPVIEESLTFAGKSDFASNLSLVHAFSIFEDNATITPTLTINASTQNSYNDYYQKRKFAKTKKGKKIPYAVYANASDVSSFKILDYEISTPLEYSLHKCTFNFIPVLALPVHPNTIIYTAKIINRPDVKKTFVENIGPAFFWSLEFSYEL